jgi:L-aminopeptidase/D-esterase-like protein
MMRPGRLNLITDVAGLHVGNASDAPLKSGVTVLTADRPFVAGVDVMGGAPGTRETDLLAPGRLVREVDALVLAGGSAFGLDAASGVVEAFRLQSKGFRAGDVVVPIVPAAILFDLRNGGRKDWVENPYRALGTEALAAASETFDLGTAGAGFGAMTATLKGGLGSASLVLDNRLTVGALVAVNSFGSVTWPDGRTFLAAPFEFAAELGGFPPATGSADLDLPRPRKPGHLAAGTNTTIAIVATDARLDKAGALRMAEAAQDGIARAIQPSHTPFDGDLIFGVSTGAVDLGPEKDIDAMRIGHAAAICLSRAIARAVHAAKPMPGDLLPCWTQLAV